MSPREYCPTHTRQPLDRWGECAVCERLIERAEDARGSTAGGGDVDAMERSYERHLDTMGGSR
jgi:hypothetical protein